MAGDVGLKISATLVAALFLICSLGACHSRGRIIDSGDAGAFALDPDSTWGVGFTRAKVGEARSAGSVVLCKKPSERTVTLQSIEPVSITGQVRLDGIGVRHAFSLGPHQESDANKYLVGDMRGAPRGLHDPAGFVVDTTCPGRPEPVTEIVVTMTETGSPGGALEGLRVDYLDGSDLHELVIHWHFGLCETGDVQQPC